MIISVPVQTETCPLRPATPETAGIGDHVSVAGLYRAPLFRKLSSPSLPPHTIISVPVQMVALELALVRSEPLVQASPVVLIEVHESVAGW